MIVVMMKKSAPYWSQGMNGVAAKSKSSSAGRLGDKYGIIVLENKIAGPEDRAIKRAMIVSILKLIFLISILYN